ncbi:MAG: ATP-binding protein [Candidatus Aminicenantes bacterium]|nr:ATP-binding protein [Candidatus Aminicenantes bacterium]MDH5384773.1 ATP-binding protein [Candidatus Aminicenantes bacterium]MDH5743566.1 ATP-binding protein [Candidatus Aminicenantes bacterium]
MIKSLKIESNLSEIDKIRSFLKDVLGDYNLSEEAFYLIELALLEMCINIVRHAYPDAKGEISLKIWSQEGKVFFEIRDWGVPFNPRDAQEPDIHEMISKGKTGGLGILLARKLMDGFQYKREDNQNVLVMHKKIEEAGSSSI